MDDLVQLADLGVPESCQLRVLLTDWQGLAKALFHLRKRAGLQRVGTISMIIECLFLFAASGFYSGLPLCGRATSASRISCNSSSDRGGGGGGGACLRSKRLITLTTQKMANAMITN